MKKCVFLVLITCFLSVNPSFATDLGRSFGLGGAFIGVADDPSAIFYNPAGLSQIKKPEVGASGGSDSYTSSTKFDVRGILPTIPIFRTKGTENTVFPDFFGATYPFLSAANPLVAGLALGNNYELNISEAGNVPPPIAPTYNKLGSTVLVKTESKALGMGYQVMQNLSLGLSLIWDDSVKNLGVIAVDETGVLYPLPALVFNTSANGRTSVLLGGLYKFDERTSIGATINVPGDAVRNATAFLFPPASPTYIQFSYLEKLPPVFGIGGSYRPLPALLLALDVKNTPALAYKTKVQTDLWGDGAKDKIESDAYTEFHAGCEYTFDLGGGADMPIRIGYASIPVHSSMNAWDVLAIDPVIGVGSIRKCSTKKNVSLMALSVGYKKDNFSVDLGIQSLSEDFTAIKAEVGTKIAGVNNSAIVLRGLLSCGISF